MVLKLVKHNIHNALNTSILNIDNGTCESYETILEKVKCQTLLRLSGKTIMISQILQ